MKTSKKHLEKLKKINEKRFSVILRSIGDGVISTDVKSNVTFMNDVAERLTGWKLNRASGKQISRVLEIIDEITEQSIESPTQKALKEGKIVGLGNHVMLKSKKGKKTPIADSAAPIRDDHNSIIGSVLIFRDVTEKKKAEEDMKKHIEDLEKFNEVSVQRELKMIDLKKKIVELEKALGRKPSYKLVGGGGTSKNREVI